MGRRIRQTKRIIIINMRKLLQKLKNYYLKLKTWNKVRACRASDHKFGALILIERIPIGEWEEERAGQSIRNVNDKYRCENCNTVFIRNGRWDYKFL